MKFKFQCQYTQLYCNIDVLGIYILFFVCICATKAQFSSCKRENVTCKTKNSYCPALYRKQFSIFSVPPKLLFQTKHDNPIAFANKFSYGYEIQFGPIRNEGKPVRRPLGKIFFLIRMIYRCRKLKLPLFPWK